MINIAVPGINGRMGQAVAKAIMQADDLRLVVATVRDTSEQVGQKVANSDVVITSKILNSEFAVMIDFTLPEGLMEHVEYCHAHKKAMVIGTTGLSQAQTQRIESAAKDIPIVLAANMSVGVNITYKLLAAACKMLDPKWNMSIIDLHHEHKKDVPSGTAKTMAKILADNSGQDLSQIVIDSHRKGEIVGSHIVTFQTPAEIITIAHEAQDRAIFADGAITAARWVYGKEAGLYSMLDVVETAYHST